MLCAWYVIAIELPGWIVAKYSRSEFMSGCTLGHLDDERLELCSAAYERYQAVVANGWRPVVGKSP